MSSHSFGWIPAIPYHRDFMFLAVYRAQETARLHGLAPRPGSAIQDQWPGPSLSFRSYNGGSVFSPQQKEFIMQTWEYMALNRMGGRWADDQFDGRHPAEKLNDLGKDGWELVSAFYDGSGYNFYLKRMTGGETKTSPKKNKAK